MKHLIAAALALGVIAPVAAAPRPDQPAAWQSVVTNADGKRLKEWRDAWLEGLTQAQAGGFRAATDREGKLLDPDAALNQPTAPDGDYRCRWVKLGRKGGLGAAFQALPPVPCTIHGSRFRVQGGVQRPNGMLWRYDGARLLFLGAISVGDEAASMQYGRDPDRNRLGLFERIGERRWRLIIPRPVWESAIDVIEVTPAR